MENGKLVSGSKAHNNRAGSSRWNSDNIFNLLCILLGAFATVFVIIKALYTPPAGDELLTYFVYVQPGEMLPFEAFRSANNHFMNSWLTYIFYRLFGDDIFVLRLPNILSFGIYLYYVWKFRGLFKSPVTGLAWYIAALSSLYLISYFHFSRGYGISMALLLASLYHLLRYTKAENRKDFYAGLIFSMLNAWTNLSLLMPILITGLLFLYHFLRYRNFEIKSISRKDIWLCALFYLVPLLLACLHAVQLKSAGALYHGGGTDFFDSVVYSLLTQISDNKDNGPLIFLPFLFILIAVSIYNFLLKRNDTGLNIVQILFWGSVAATIAVHFVLGVFYPHDRAALHFFPLFLLVLAFALDRSQLKLAVVVSFFPAALLLLHLALNINNYYTPYSKNEGVPQSFYQKIKETKIQTGELPTISAHGILGKVFSYYDYKDGGELNSVTEVDFPARYADFLILNDWNKSEKISMLNFYHVLEEDKNTGLVLMRANKRPGWKEVKNLEQNALTDSGYLTTLFDLPVQQYRGQPLACNISFDATGNENPVKWWLEFSALDSVGNAVYYQVIDLQWIKYDLSHPTRFQRRVFTDKIPLDAVNYKITIRKFGKRVVKLSNLEADFYVVENAEKYEPDVE